MNMTLSSKQKILMGVIFLILGAYLGACSTFSFRSAEEQLRARVDGLMTARINSEWGKVYEFYAPAYKENNSRDAFVAKSRQSNVLRYQIESIEIAPSGDEATVKVKNDMSALTFEFPGIVMTQRWVKTGWNWYLDVNSKSEKP
jgi:hypothetical protein